MMDKRDNIFKVLSIYYFWSALCILFLEKVMAPHSSTLAWKIPWMEEPGGLPSMGSHRVGHDWSDLAAAAYIISIPNKNIFQKLKQNKHIFRKIKPFYQQTNKKGNTKSLFFLWLLTIKVILLLIRIIITTEINLTKKTQSNRRQEQCRDKEENMV